MTRKEFVDKVQKILEKRSPKFYIEGLWIGPRRKIGRKFKANISYVAVSKKPGIGGYVDDDITI